MLTINKLESGYGEMQVLWGIDLRVEKGSITILLGANGAGKTTLLKTIIGLVKPWNGRIIFGDRDITMVPPHHKVELGLGLVPEGRHLFPEMTVYENLLMGAYTKHAKEHLNDSLELVYNLFPRLRERRGQKAGTLSGGEQQMLAIGRTLMGRPRLIMLDEPSQGLAPILAEEVISSLGRLRDETGISILLAEQSIHLALEYAEYGYIIEQGRVVMEGSKEDILNLEEIRKAYLGL